MNKPLLYIFCIVFSLYLLVCLLLYFFQERFIFFPERLSPEQRFTFQEKFEEIFIATADSTRLHALHFKADSAKGVILYLHGNAGSVSSWGGEAAKYTALGYDVLMPDYRGYGKSEGRISSEAELYRDVQAVYDYLKARYDEGAMVVLGYSLGTGPAAYLAANNAPGMLVLHAPYYSFAALMRVHYPVVPRFLLRYRLRTHRWLQQTAAPVFIFHGSRDEIIPHSSALQLKPLLKAGDRFITLDGAGHNGITYHPAYQGAIADILR